MQNFIHIEEKYLIPVYKRHKILFVKAEGIKLWDVNNKEYLDFFGQGVNIIGHRHPAVIEAIQQALNSIIYFSNLFYTAAQLELAKLLVKNLSFCAKVFFCNSGTEAIEAAIKFARAYGYYKNKNKKKYKIITMYNSFHGRTYGALSATAQEKFHIGFYPLLEGFKYVNLNDLTQLKEAIDEETCAVMLELIQGEGGINVAKKDYVNQLSYLCKENDLLLIVDEVQTAPGRLGQLFGYKIYNIEPDIITLAKGLAGGLPIGVVIAKDKVAEYIKYGMHASTFGGNVLSSQAAIAVINTILKENLLINVKTMHSYLIKGLRELAKSYKIIKEIRGEGLMLGMEMNLNKEDCSNIVEECLRFGIIINCCANNVLRFLPPLIVEKEQINKLIDVLNEVLKKYA